MCPELGKWYYEEQKWRENDAPTERADVRTYLRPKGKTVDESS